MGKLSNLHRQYSIKPGFGTHVTYLQMNSIKAMVTLRKK